MSKSRDLGWYLANQLVQGAMPLLLTPVYTRFIAPDEFGVQYLFTVVLIVGTGLANWGLPYAYERFFFQLPTARRDRLLGTIVGFSAGLLLLFAAGVWLLEAQLAPLFVDDAHWTPMLGAVFVTGALTHLNSLCLADLKNRLRARSYAVLDLLRFGLFHLIGLIAVVAWQWGIWGQIVGNLVSQALLLCWFVGRRGVFTLFRIDFRLLRECLAFGWPMMAKVAVNIVNTSVDKYLVAFYASLMALGLYGKAQAWSYSVFAFMTTVQNVYAPLWNRKLFATPDAPPQSVGALFSEYCALCALPCALFVVFAQEVVWALTPASYHAAIPLTALLACNYALMTFGKLQGSIVAYLKAVKFGAFTASMLQVVNVLLNLVMIPRYGALGAVAVSVGLGLGGTLVTALYLRGRHQTGYEKGYLAALYGLMMLGAALAVTGYYADIPYAVSLVARIALFLALAYVVSRRIGPSRILGVVRRAMPKRSAPAKPGATP